MKIVVVGGTGFVGGHTALFLQRLGHEATLMSRSRPSGTSALNQLPFIAGNYIYTGRGVPDYTPPQAETELLGYHRGLVPGVVEETCRYYSGLLAT